MAGAVSAAQAARRLQQPAFISVADDESVAAADGGSGPLAGIPFAVKDNIDVAGVASTAACPTRTDPAERHATAVQRLVDAGAIPIGKTNMDQFATGLVGTRSPYGACHSVASPQHVSGGSSSGSGVAVAAGVVPFALGTDTAGSGRVPAAFNGIFGVKPTRGLVSLRGVLLACPSLDCVSIMARDLRLAKSVLEVMAGFDSQDPWSRRAPAVPPAGVARAMGVVGVPAGELELEPEHREAWEAALARYSAVARLVPIDVTAMLAAARLLYESPFVAERLATFGHLLQPDGPHLDPTVRKIVLGADGLSAEALFQALHRLASLKRDVDQTLAGIDAVMLPTTPCHPTLADVAADPVGVNSRLGTYTNMVNLLDLCAVAMPAGTRPDGLPFGVQLLAPAFADVQLIDFAERLGAGSGGIPPVAAGNTLLAVCGAHLSGEPLNPLLVQAGAALYRRARTAPGYRMVRIEGSVPKPGLIDTGDGPSHGMEVELWEVRDDLLASIAAQTVTPLGIGTVRLDDGSEVAGYVADSETAADAIDISEGGGWRAHLASAVSSTG